MEEIQLWTVLAPPVPRDIDILSPFGRGLMNAVEREHTAKEGCFRAMKAPDAFRCFVDSNFEDDGQESDNAECLHSSQGSKFNEPQQLSVDENGNNCGTFKSTGIIERSYQDNYQNSFELRKKCNTISNNIPFTNNSVGNNSGILTYSTDIYPATFESAGSRVFGASNFLKLFRNRRNLKNIDDMETIPETQLTVGGSEGLLDEDFEFVEATPIFENIFSSDNLRLLNRSSGNKTRRPYNFNEENGRRNDFLVKTKENNFGDSHEHLAEIIEGGRKERPAFQNVLNFPASRPLSTLDNDWCISDNFIESLGFTENTGNTFPKNNYLLSSVPDSQAAVTSKDSSFKNPEKQKGKIKKVFGNAPDHAMQSEADKPKMGEEPNVSSSKNVGYRHDPLVKITEGGRKERPPFQNILNFAPSRPLSTLDNDLSISGNYIESLRFTKNTETTYPENNYLLSSVPDSQAAIKSKDSSSKNPEKQKVKMKNVFDIAPDHDMQIEEDMPKVGEEPKVSSSKNVGHRHDALVKITEEGRKERLPFQNVLNSRPSRPLSTLDNDLSISKNFIESLGCTENTENIFPENNYLLSSVQDSQGAKKLKDSSSKNPEKQKGKIKNVFDIAPDHNMQIEEDMPKVGEVPKVSSSKNFGHRHDLLVKITGEGRKERPPFQNVLNFPPSRPLSTLDNDCSISGNFIESLGFTKSTENTFPENNYLLSSVPDYQAAITSKDSSSKNPEKQKSKIKNVFGIAPDHDMQIEEDMPNLGEEPKVSSSKIVGHRHDPLVKITEEGRKERPPFQNVLNFPPSRPLSTLDNDLSISKNFIESLGCTENTENIFPENNYLLSSVQDSQGAKKLKDSFSKNPEKQKGKIKNVFDIAPDHDMQIEEDMPKVGEEPKVSSSKNVGHRHDALVKITEEGRKKRPPFQNVLNFPPSRPLSTLDNDRSISGNFIESLGFTKNTENTFPENNYLLSSVQDSQGAIKLKDSFSKNPEKQKGKIKNVFDIAPNHDMQIEEDMRKVGDEPKVSSSKNFGYRHGPLVKITEEGRKERPPFQNVLNFPSSRPLSTFDNDWCISDNFIESLGFTKNSENNFPENNYLLSIFPDSQAAINPKDSSSKNPEKQKGQIQNFKVFDNNRQIEENMPKMGEEPEISCYSKHNKTLTNDVANNNINSDNYDGNRFKMYNLTNSSSDSKVSDYTSVMRNNSAKFTSRKAKNNSGNKKINKGTISRIEISNKPCKVPKTRQLKLTDIIRSKRKTANETCNEKQNQEVVKHSKPFKRNYSLFDFLKPRKSKGNQVGKLLNQNEINFKIGSVPTNDDGITNNEDAKPKWETLSNASANKETKFCIPNKSRFNFDGNNEPATSQTELFSFE